MIVSASYRTDIPAFYGDWFVARLNAGTVRVVNPYGGPARDVPLDRAHVDGFVFWTRNVGPFVPVLRRLAGEGIPFVVHYTITGYPRVLDTATVPAERAITHLRGLAAEFGPRCAVWRYDPLVATTLTPPAWHLETFRRLCRQLAGAVDEVVVSFAHIYRKTARNLAAAARAGGFAWFDPEAAEKRRLLAGLVECAHDHGVRTTLCGQPALRVPGVAEARCVDALRLQDIAGRPIAAVRRPHRRDCGCWASTDIGDYDTCPHGCVYCYAVNSRDTAKRRFAGHDPQAPSLGCQRRSPARSR
jgi:hypothetical protein